MPSGSDEWVDLYDAVKSKTYNWNRRSHRTVWTAPAGVEVVWVGAQDEEGGPATGTRLLVPVGMTFLLFLLGDGRRGEGLGIPSPLLGCHCVPVFMQPGFQQSLLFMFWR